MRRLVGLLIMTILVGSAVATPVPVGGTLQAAHTETFNLGASGTADVVCNVYGYASGDFAGRYVYTYQINNHSTIGISFFSVELKSGANVDSLSDAGGGVNSAYWGVVNTMISANGSFTSPIAYNASSAVLWFASNYSYTYGSGGLFGFDSIGIPNYAGVTASTGPTHLSGLLTPVPEPATISLLAAGGLAALIRRRKKV